MFKKLFLFVLVFTSMNAASQVSSIYTTNGIKPKDPTNSFHFELGYLAKGSFLLSLINPDNEGILVHNNARRGVNNLSDENFILLVAREKDSELNLYSARQENVSLSAILQMLFYSNIPFGPGYPFSPRSSRVQDARKISAPDSFVNLNFEYKTYDEVLNLLEDITGCKFDEREKTIVVNGC